MLSSPPRTVILGLWPYATDDQLRYYVDGYNELYPDAELLLLHYSPRSSQQLSNALHTLTAQAEKRPQNPSPNVLMHLFGGCGAAQGCRLLRAYKLRTGHRLPVKAVVMDSVPKIVVPSLRRAVRSPMLLLAFLYLLAVVLYIRVFSTINFWGFEQRGKQHRHDLNNSSLLPPDARKAYVFEEKDLMFSWHDQGKKYDDEESFRDNITLSRTSVDEKSGRWTSNQERYWLGIENVWDGRS